ncbi:Nif3-like dinuclear metal center hexameric protein [Arthrobacter alpinus]|uniref:Nif3-like dinuclear metal center hexameric protein n=1 Tax=Arthrobacter alpinus TaxID=656366 RepID=UPI0009FADB71|nr:Nif3-like dinuclear metal center hexameric protein [Arthrobacter alpinus]
MSKEPTFPSSEDGADAAAQGTEALTAHLEGFETAGDAAAVLPEAVEAAGLSVVGDDELVGDVSDGDDADEEFEQEDLDTPVLSDVLVAVEELWPESLAEDWDRVGLVVGRPEAEVRRIMFAVDPTIEVVEEALEWGAQLLITHHPLLLKGVNSVAATSGKGRIVHRLIEGGCALLTVHTNGDSAVGGVSDVLADVLGLADTQPLTPAVHGLVEEGIGRVGLLPGVEKLGDLAARIFLTLPAVAGGVRVSGDRDALVQKVAVCGGAGDSLFEAVRANDADVYVTADLRHHPASEAREARTDGRPYLIDLSHFASEWLWLPPAAKALGNVLADQGFEAELRVSQTNTDPWDFILTPGN